MEIESDNNILVSSEKATSSHETQNDNRRMIQEDFMGDAQSANDSNSNDGRIELLKFGKVLGRTERAYTVIFEVSISNNLANKAELSTLLLKYANWYLYGELHSNSSKNNNKIIIQGMAFSALAQSSRWSELHNNLDWIAKCENPNECFPYLKDILINVVEFTKTGILRPRFCSSLAASSPAAPFRKPTASSYNNNNGTHQKISLKTKEIKDLSFEEMGNLGPTEFLQALKAKALYAREEAKEKDPEETFEYPLHPWQIKLNAILEPEKLSNRKIIFVVDKKGGSGKTDYYGWKGDQAGYDYVTPGKLQDVLFNSDPKAHTIFMDVARKEAEHLYYPTLEKLQDGKWNCGKYEGVKCRSKNKKKLVVFMNQFPDKFGLSEDRYFVLLLENLNTLTFIPYEAIPLPGEIKKEQDLKYADL